MRHRITTPSPSQARKLGYKYDIDVYMDQPVSAGRDKDMYYFKLGEEEKVIAKLVEIKLLNKEFNCYIINDAGTHVFFGPHTFLSSLEAAIKDRNKESKTNGI